MDLLLETEKERIRLSSLGILVTDIEATTVSIEANNQKIANRNVKLFMGATFGEKKITVTGYYHVQDIFQDEQVKDYLNGLLATVTPYHITKMFSDDTDYRFESPGERTTNIESGMATHYLSKYRYKVLLEDAIDYEFKGKSGIGLLYKVTLSFATVDIPFGYTIPTIVDLTGKSSIEYLGTVPCSQLDWPWTIELTATKAQGSYFSLTINNKTLTYTGTKNIAVGDVFLFNGMTYTLNGVNITDRTNTTYFTLDPLVGKNVPITFSSAANFKIRILNKVDFYA